MRAEFKGNAGAPPEADAVLQGSSPETVRTQPDPVAMVERLRTLGAKHPNLDLQELARRLVQGGHLAPRADWWWTLVALQREPLLRVKRFSPLRA